MTEQRREPQDLLEAIAHLRERIAKVEAHHKLWEHAGRHEKSGGDRITNIALDDGSSGNPSKTWAQDPTTGEYRVNGDIYQVNSSILISGQNGNGEVINDANSITPHTDGQSITDFNPVASTTWEAAGSFVIFNHTGTNRYIQVSAWGSATGKNTIAGGTPTAVARVGVSFDNGGSFSYGPLQYNVLNGWASFAPVAFKKALATDDVIVQLEFWRNGTIDDFNNNFLLARAEQYV